MDSNISIATCPARTTNRALITGSSSQFNQRIGRTIHEGDEPSSFALSHLPTSIDAEDSSARTLQAIERNLPDSGFIKGGDIPSAADIVVFDLGMIRMDEWMRTIGGIHVLGLTIRWCVVAGTSSLPDINKLGVDLTKYPKVCSTLFPSSTI